MSVSLSGFSTQGAMSADSFRADASKTIRLRMSRRSAASHAAIPGSRSAPRSARIFSTRKFRARRDFDGFVINDGNAAVTPVASAFRRDSICESASRASFSAVWNDSVSATRPRINLIRSGVRLSSVPHRGQSRLPVAPATAGRASASRKRLVRRRVSSSTFARSAM